MLDNTTGSNNIALGYEAGENLTTGSNNMDIGNLGVAAESNTIRIGTQGTQTATFIAGIFGSSVTGDAVNGKQHRTARHRDVVGALQARHPRHGRGQQQPDEAASGDLPLQERPAGDEAVRAGRRGGRALYPELVSYRPTARLRRSII